MTFRFHHAASLGRFLGRKSPSPGICEGWCSPVRFDASGDQVAGTEFRRRGWWHPADMSAQDEVGVRTRYHGRPGQRATGPRVISRTTRTTACSPARSTACRLRRVAEARRGDIAGRTIVSSAWKDSVPPIITYGWSRADHPFLASAASSRNSRLPGAGSLSPSTR
jgi:hypothetical protein